MPSVLSTQTDLVGTELATAHTYILETQRFYRFVTENTEEPAKLRDMCRIFRNAYPQYLTDLPAIDDLTQVINRNTAEEEHLARNLDHVDLDDAAGEDNVDLDDAASEDIEMDNDYVSANDDNAADELMDFPIEETPNEIVGKLSLVEIDKVRQQIINSFEVKIAKPRIEVPILIGELVVVISNQFIKISERERDVLRDYFEMGLMLSQLKTSCYNKHKIDIMKLKKEEKKRLKEEKAKGEKPKQKKPKVVMPKKQDYFQDAITKSGIDYKIPRCNFLILFSNIVKEHIVLLRSNLGITYFKKNMKYVTALCNRGDF